MIQDKLKRLSEMKRELSIEEKMLNYYTKHAPERKVTFTMQVADEINRQAYEKKKQLITDLEKGIIREGEIINLHFTISPPSFQHDALNRIQQLHTKPG